MSCDNLQSRFWTIFNFIIKYYYLFKVPAQSEDTFYVKLNDLNESTYLKQKEKKG